MRIGNFAVMVTPGIERGDGYVDMEHGSQYQISLFNFGQHRCDAEISVDGKSIGGFRINGYGSIVLERPANDTGKFTFYRSGSSEGIQAGLDSVSNAELGLISVRFKPEMYVPRPRSVLRTAGISGQSCGMPMQDSGVYGAVDAEMKTSGGIQHMNSTRGMFAGGTGLSGQSSQHFVEVANLNYDPSGEVVINLRLISSQTVIPRKLQPVENAIPAPVYRG